MTVELDGERGYWERIQKGKWLSNN